MSRLLHDRYCAYGSTHAWDLATGESVRVEAIAADDAEPPAPASLLEVLDHGREGEPRWVVADTTHGPRSPVVARRVAAAARARGYVPIAADVYLRLREMLDADLAQRTLLLIVHPAASLATGRAALVDAAARWPRPHVLLTFASPRPALTVHGEVVCEARAVYGLRTPRPPLAATLPDDVLRHVTRGSRATEFMSSGRHAAAERLLRDVAAALVRRQAQAPATQALISLGRLLLERGRALDADRTFGEAAVHAHAGKDESLSLSARVWQAAARTDAGQLTAAESVCRAALLAGVLSNGERARGEATLARILLWQGRTDEAAERDLSCPDIGDGTTAYVATMGVRVALAVGDVFTAGQRARALLDVVDRVEGSPHAQHSGLLRVIALSAHTRMLMATGDLASVEERMQHLHNATQYARTPLRFARMRLLLYDVYRRAGRSAEADRELAYLRRVETAAPPLLRDAIARRAKSVEPAPATMRPRVAGRHLASAMVTIAQDHEDDREAIAKLIAFAADALQTSRVELCSADAGPVTAVMSNGSGLATELGARVLQAGIAIGPEGSSAGGEQGVPIRLGARLVGALCTRWPVDRTPPADAGDILDLAAAVLAPRLEGLQSAARDVARASTLIRELVGSSQAINDVRRAVTRAASAPFAVLIEGSMRRYAKIRPDLRMPRFRSLRSPPLEGTAGRCRRP